MMASGAKAITLSLLFRLKNTNNDSHKRYTWVRLRYIPVDCRLMQKSGSSQAPLMNPYAMKAEADEAKAWAPRPIMREGLAKRQMEPM